jgi:hypothetical protein
VTSKKTVESPLRLLPPVMIVGRFDGALPPNGNRLAPLPVGLTSGM